MMGPKSIAVQLWLWFIGCLIVSITIIFATIFIVLRLYMEEQIYTSLELDHTMEVANLLMDDDFKTEDLVVEFKEIDDSLGINHYVYDGETFLFSEIEEDGSFEINTEQASIDTDDIIILDEGFEEFELNTMVRNEMQNQYQIVSRRRIDGEDITVYSYMSYDVNRMVLERFWYVFIIVISLIILLFIPARLVANRLINPLVKLEQAMSNIAERNWNETIAVKGAAEIEKLANSCEVMREKLVDHDNNQKEILQSISHELKTPIMVIRNYIQASYDGYYPNGSVESSFQAIDKEVMLIQKRVSDLLYITNIDYLQTHIQDVAHKEISVNEIIEEVSQRFMVATTCVQWNMDLEDVEVIGNREHFKVILENLLQNAIRYAEKSIHVECKSNGKDMIFRISNDGPHVDETRNIFKRYVKGAKGQTGLGLYIVKRTVELYDGKIWYENDDVGVSFYVQVPVGFVPK